MLPFGLALFVVHTVERWTDVMYHLEAGTLGTPLLKYLAYIPGVSLLFPLLGIVLSQPIRAFLSGPPKLGRRHYARFGAYAGGLWGGWFFMRNIVRGFGVAKHLTGHVALLLGTGHVCLAVHSFASGHEQGTPRRRVAVCCVIGTVTVGLYFGRSFLETLFPPGSPLGVAVELLYGIP